MKGRRGEERGAGTPTVHTSRAYGGGVGGPYEGVTGEVEQRMGGPHEEEGGEEETKAGEC